MDKASVKEMFYFEKPMQIIPFTVKHKTCYLHLVIIDFQPVKAH